MTRVVVDIGRLVVHGAGEFASEAFADSLRQEIARRMGAPGAQAVVQQNTAAATVESRAAAAVAAQLFERGMGP